MNSTLSEVGAVGVCVSSSNDVFASEVSFAEGAGASFTTARVRSPRSTPSSTRSTVAETFPASPPSALTVYFPGAIFSNSNLPPPRPKRYLDV